MDANEVIEKILNEVNLNQSKFLENVGVSTSTFSDLKKGKIKSLSRKVATKIRDTYPQFRLEWLMTGEGDMYDKSPSSINGTGTDHLLAALQTIDKLVDQMAEKDRQIGQLIDIIGSSQKKDAARDAECADARGLSSVVGNM